MSMTVREINNNLYDQLDIVEKALELAEQEQAEKTVEYLKECKTRIERKLYQEPMTRRKRDDQ